jgi:hypothetical protein
VLGDVRDRKEGKWTETIMSDVSNTVERGLRRDVFSLLSATDFTDEVAVKVCARRKPKVQARL